MRPAPDPGSKTALILLSKILKGLPTMTTLMVLQGRILNILKLIGKDLLDYSLETVKMFRDDAVKAGYSVARAAGTVVP